MVTTDNNSSFEHPREFRAARNCAEECARAPVPGCMMSQAQITAGPDNAGQGRVIYRVQWSVPLSCEVGGRMSALLRVLIVDDESLARMRLAHLVNELSNPWSVVGQCADALEALKWLDRHGRGGTASCSTSRMPGILADLASRLRPADLPAVCVVFVTAHPEHVLTAELEAVTI